MVIRSKIETTEIQENLKYMGEILEVDYARKTSGLHGNRGILGSISTIVGYLVWFILLPATIFVTFFQERTRHAMTECDESTKPTGRQHSPRQVNIVTSEESTDYDGDDHDQHYRDYHHDTDNHGGQIIPYQSHYLNGCHINHFTWENATSDHVLPVFLSQSPCRVTYNPSKNFERIVNNLIWLEDNGDFEAFDRLSSIVLDRYATCNPEITAAVLVEQSRCMFYRNSTRAKSLARKALEVSSQTAFPGMFAARACLVISAIYRRKGKLGKAKLFLENAEQNLTNTNYYEDWSRFYNAYGSYLNSFIDTVSNPSAELYKNAYESFHRQMQAASRDSRAWVREKNRFYALLKMARTMLDANTIFGQQREIPARDIHLAVECLDKIESEFCADNMVSSIPRGTHMQFLLVRCKQYFREKRFQEAGPLLAKCLKIARTSGYERDLALIMKGVRRIKELDYRVGEEIMGTESTDAPVTEGSDENDSAFSGEKECDNSTTDSIDIFGSELSG